MSETGQPVPPPGATVLTRQLIICNRRGLHARAAAKFVSTAERYGAAVELRENFNNPNGH